MFVVKVVLSLFVLAASNDHCLEDASDSKCYSKTVTHHEGVDAAALLQGSLGIHHAQTPEMVQVEDERDYVQVEDLPKPSKNDGSNGQPWPNVHRPDFKPERIANENGMQDAEKYVDAARKALPKEAEKGWEGKKKQDDSRPHGMHDAKKYVDDARKVLPKQPKKGDKKEKPTKKEKKEEKPTKKEKKVLPNFGKKGDEDEKPTKDQKKDQKDRRPHGMHDAKKYVDDARKVLPKQPKKGDKEEKPPKNDQKKDQEDRRPHGMHDAKKYVDDARKVLPKQPKTGDEKEKPSRDKKDEQKDDRRPHGMHDAKKYVHDTLDGLRSSDKPVNLSLLVLFVHAAFQAYFH